MDRTARKKTLSPTDLREDALAEIRANLRPGWRVLLGCARCKTICVGAGCACCRSFRSHNPGSGIVYPAYAGFGNDTEPAHYPICPVAEALGRPEERTTTP